jgi:hypothetical protein
MNGRASPRRQMLLFYQPKCFSSGGVALKGLTTEPGPKERRSTGFMGLVNKNMGKGRGYCPHSAEKLLPPGPRPPGKEMIYRKMFSDWLISYWLLSFEWPFSDCPFSEPLFSEPLLSPSPAFLSLFMAFFLAVFRPLINVIENS